MSHARSLAIALAILILFAASVCADEKPIKIPLKNVWALEMPGTRDIRELEPERFGKQVRKLPSEERFRLYRESLLEGLRRMLTAPPRAEQKTKNGIAVEGVGTEALRRAHNILTAGSSTNNSLPGGKDVTLVFFSREFDRYVHLRSIERCGHAITIYYVFVPHLTHEFTWHMALIPMGRLPAGKWQVRIVQTPMDKEHLQAGYKPVAPLLANQFVCNSFQFEIEPNVEKR